MKPVIVISTYPDKSSISKFAKVIVQSKLVACVNYTKISSVYSWDDKIENSSEYLAIFKTSSKNKSKLKKEIQKSHPYDVPEIAEISVNSINDSYLKWIENSTL